MIGVAYRHAESQQNRTIASWFLEPLTHCLYEQCKKRVIVLIDEYDAPLDHAFRKGFYEKASSFFGKIYSIGLKSNPALNSACLMGIVEIRGTGMFSGLNNLVIYSSGDEEFSQYFGFTRDEVSDFLDGDEERIQDVMEWYNGYYIGSHQMINPWSFMSYMRRYQLKSYWVQTESIDSIRTIINPVLNVQLIKILGKLYTRTEHTIGELYAKVDYGKETNIDSILAFLVHTGYLTYKEGKVSIPNLEIKHEWRDHVLGLSSHKILNSTILQAVNDALKGDPFSKVSLVDVVKKVLASCSYHDLPREISYHLFYFGIFLVVCGPKATSTNKEAGHGRYDIKIALEDMKRLFIFEFKHSKVFKNLEKDANKGLQQIFEQKYYDDAQYNGWTCFSIGVSFYKKLMSDLAYEEIRV